MSGIKDLFTNTYRGELKEGKQEAVITDFTFTITNGTRFRASNCIGPAKVAMPKKLFTGNNITFALDEILPLFETGYEPTNSGTAADYFTLIMTTPEGRIIRKNLFEHDFAIFLKQTRIQLTGDNLTDIVPLEWIKAMLNKPISIWVSYPNVLTRSGATVRVQNINYCAPLTDLTKPDTATAPTTSDTTEEPIF